MPTWIVVVDFGLLLRLYTMVRLVYGHCSSIDVLLVKSCNYVRSVVDVFPFCPGRFKTYSHGFCQKISFSKDCTQFSLLYMVEEWCVNRRMWHWVHMIVSTMIVMFVVLVSFMWWYRSAIIILHRILVSIGLLYLLLHYRCTYLVISLIDNFHVNWICRLNGRVGVRNISRTTWWKIASALCMDIASIRWV
jgi:hypothetical protein